MKFSNRFLFIADVFLLLLSIGVSYIIRFDTFRVWDYLAINWQFVPLLLAVRLPLFNFFGLYRRFWRYASVNEIVIIVESILLGSAIIAVVIFIFLVPFGRIAFFPRSIVLLEGMLTLLFIGGIRFSFRLSQHVRAASLKNGQTISSANRRVLVYGAGDAGAIVVREMRANPNLGMEPVAFLDDDTSKKGLHIHNVPVLGNRSALAQVVRDWDIDAVIIAMPSVSGHVIREIIELCRQAEVTVKTMPGLYEILSGSVKVSTIREVELEDLLRREPVKIDLAQVGQYLKGARVLVTGAGGTIGSELCRQIARFEPTALTLFDSSEHNLYQIHRELTNRFAYLKIAPVCGDVRDRNKIDFAFSRVQPQVIFHAAACKHVPMTEFNIDEGVTTNILGTRNVVEASIAHAASRFVLISTDKAVNPTSVMGATKRVAELILQNAARDSQTILVAVRFGNVLGSSGSVVPLFKEQIATGGPVTVMHPEIDRFFMTIPEAVSLIVQAAALSQGGELFVLDMGKPVKINDLAKDLIRLSGFEPGQDIQIVYTGLRPGEKMHEELFTEKDQRVATKHQQIFVTPTEPPAREKLERDLRELETLVQRRDPVQLKLKLKEIVPEYTPDGRVS